MEIDSLFSVVKVLKPSLAPNFNPKTVLKGVSELPKCRKILGTPPPPRFQPLKGPRMGGEGSPGEEPGGVLF